MHKMRSWHRKTMKILNKEEKVVHRPDKLGRRGESPRRRRVGWLLFWDGTNVPKTQKLSLRSFAVMGPVG